MESRYQRKQEEKKMTRMEMIKELEAHGISVSKKANTDRVLKKYSQFKDDQKQKEKKTVSFNVCKMSRQKRITIARKKQTAIAEMGRNTVPRYRALKK